MFLTFNSKKKKEAKIYNKQVLKSMCHKYVKDIVLPSVKGIVFSLKLCSSVKEYRLTNVPNK